MAIRSASHAGSWYSSNGSDLSNQLECWLNEVDVFHRPARAVIAPHAGYRYSGPCSAFAYKQIDPGVVKRIFILGPSHFSRFSGCALSEVEKYETPLYDLIIDSQIVEELSKMKQQFQILELDEEETEHSIEMHLPYIAKVMEKYRNHFTIVPVLVGSLSTKQEITYGQIFAKYLADPENLFIISSDFCHWGKRFSFTYYDNSNHQEIYQSIEELDRMGMKIIEELSPENFEKYLKGYRNTICGRNPILILLRTIQEVLKQDNKSAEFKFLKYAQSQKCKHMNDSSVSYAAGALILN